MEIKKTGSFTIERQLPSLNSYINACRKNKYAGAKFKRDTENEIGVYIAKARLSGELPVFGEIPCEIDIIWYEKSLRRDADNIQSAQKFILDALQRFGIIRNDSRKYVPQIHHDIRKSNNNRDYVTVILREKVENIT